MLVPEDIFVGDVGVVYVLSQTLKVWYVYRTHSQLAYFCGI